MSERERKEASLPATVISLGAGDPVASGVVPAPIDSSAGAVESGTTMPSRPLFGRYRILGLLGSGGMGNVYRALDTELDEVVALKMLRHELAEHAQVVDRFRREVRLARRVTHRNIARVFDIGEIDGEKFLTMELIDGPSLAEVLAERRALPLAEALELCSVVCDGLEAAHAAGVVHLDLKPGNVLMERGGRVVLTDFGIARALAGYSGAQTDDFAVGTPGYMAPEQVQGRADVDARADIYALGALLYEMVTGRQPWAGGSFYAVASSRLREPPPDPRVLRPDLPVGLSEIVARAMALAPEDRYPSAVQMALALSLLAAPPSMRNAPGGGPAGVERRARPAEKAVAVLPFRNAGGPGDDYLAEELTDDLIDALSMTPGLRVSARGVVAGYVGAAVDPREVGRALGVQVVTEGSVRRINGRVRVSARLVSVDEGFQLWAKRFDRPEEDVLAVNDEAARAIAAALTVDFARPPRPAPPGAAAVDLYVRARNKYRRFWPEPVTAAIALFTEAEALAPGDPAILGGLALARARLSYFVADAIPAAIEAGRRAIAASAAQGEPHLALGSALLNAGSGAEAIRELRHAVALSPGLGEAHAALGRMLVEAGELDEGTRRLHAAVELDAEAPLALGALLRVHALAGEWDRARELAERSRTTEGLLGWLVNRARLCAWQRDAAGAATLAGAGAPLGQKGDFPAAMLRLVASEGRGPVPDVMSLQSFPGASQRAEAYLWQSQVEACALGGDREGALAALEQADARALSDRLWLTRCPLLADLHEEPRYLAVAASVARRCQEILAAYWAR